ncbi:HEAT repeat domain-containing protein [Vitiosangium sp. GDMCC 1.1324]|uniref:HEAT repeat domain-containing protein n=1 Tax=Vitiosangium sp. (strain GDMCC 1.1324) TaxID=2138576 RepID=UPI00130E50E3|nr:HEAT repeat domain-containing protein [Vitiosangium sp. GDMCC 1.1324]
MARGMDIEQWRDELVAACRFGDESRAQALVRQPGSRKARALLEAMLEDPAPLVRQAAVFGLGELGGNASARRLKQQLALEEARGNFDGESVVEAITQALGHIEATRARDVLVRRLEHLTAGEAGRSDLNTVACALWRRRHPDLLPAVREAVARLDSTRPTPLHGLLVLLEKSPGELGTWAGDLSVPVEQKAEVLAVLTEEVPETLWATLPSFIATAHALADTAARQKGAATYYCEDLFALLLLHPEQLLPSLPEEARSRLREVARKCVAASSSPNCSLRAAVLLEHVGRPEDAPLIEAHRPAEPVLAKVFDDAARALHRLQES